MSIQLLEILSLTQYTSISQQIKHDVCHFPHYTSHCESKNTWVDPNQLNQTPLLHFSVIMAIRIGNEPTSTICSELSQSNSNVAKVSIKKWSKTLIWVYGNGVLGIPKYLTNACKARYLTIFWYAQKPLPQTQIKFQDHIIIDTFATLLL